MPARSLPSSSTCGTSNGRRRRSRRRPAGMRCRGRGDARNRRERDAIASDERPSASRGCWLGGGAVPSLTQRSIASEQRPQRPRSTRTGLSSCCPLRHCAAGTAPGQCCVPARKYTRTLSGSVEIGSAVGRRVDERRRRGRRPSTRRRCSCRRSSADVCARAVVVEQPFGPAADRIALRARRRTGNAVAVYIDERVRRRARARSGSSRAAPAMCAITPSKTCRPCSSVLKPW